MCYGVKVLMGVSGGIWFLVVGFWFVECFCYLILSL